MRLPRRVLALALLVTLVLTMTAPVALALEGSISVDAAQGTNPVTPLTKRTVDVTVRVECDGNLLPSGGNEGNLTILVKSRPAWVDASVDPALVHVSENECRGAAPVERVTRLTYAPTLAARAFAEGDVVIEAVFRAPSGSITGEDRVHVVADWYSALDAHVTRPIRVSRPGENVSFPVTVVHHGNAPARIVFAVQDESTDATVRVPAPFVLHAGAVDSDGAGRAASRGTSASIVVVVEPPPPGTGFANAPHLVNLLATSMLASDPARAGDAVPVSMLVTVKGWDPAWLGPSLYAAAALVLLCGVIAGSRVLRARG